MSLLRQLANQELPSRTLSPQQALLSTLCRAPLAFPASTKSLPLNWLPWPVSTISAAPWRVKSRLFVDAFCEQLELSCPARISALG
ncbi:MAG: hypothetical protein IPO59_10670 [Betaproteobacteria bacterium]|nr:hypothetical protein [Betaproteobacteria bacterium]MBP6636314.1 hypothetical protein [Sulfuritalea sp.]